MTMPPSRGYLPGLRTWRYPMPRLAELTAGLPPQPPEADLFGSLEQAVRQGARPLVAVDEDPDGRILCARARWPGLAAVAEPGRGLPRERRHGGGGAGRPGSRGLIPAVDHTATRESPGGLRRALAGIRNPRSRPTPGALVGPAIRCCRRRGARAGR